MVKLIITGLLFTAMSAWAQTPSDTYCDPRIPSYVYNGNLYICSNGSPVLVGGGSTFNPATPGAIGGTTPSTGNFTNLTATGKVTGQQVGAVYQADQFTGADFGAKVNACLAAIHTAGGGTCDARVLSGAQTSSASITVGDGTNRTALILPVGTITLAAGQQLIYRQYATITGQGYQGTSSKATNVICTNPTTSCVQSYNEGGGSLYSASLSNFNINSTGSIGANSVGLQLSGTGYVDVLESHFERIQAGRFNTGVLLQSTGGCICYDTFDNVDASGTSFGIRTQNISGFAFAVNSNQWRGGIIGGSVGLYDQGTFKTTYSYLDFENNTSATGAVLYIHGYNNTGTGYAVNDTGTISGGDGTATYVINSVTGGVPTSISVTAPGATYINAINQATTATSGAGTGLQVDVRVSGYMVLTGSVLVNNPYEEAGGGDYFCGVGNFVTGAFQSSSGAAYIPTYCTGTSNSFGGPASTFVWGTAATPQTIGLRSGIVFGGSQMYDDGSSGASLSLISGSSLFPVELKYIGAATNTYGRTGHSRLSVGQLIATGGLTVNGKSTHAALANPSAPTIANVGTPGSTTYQYSVVCNDANGGQSLQSSTGQTTTGNVTLDTNNYNTISWACADGYRGTDILKFSGTWQLLIAASATGNTNATTLAKDTGQSLTAYTLPVSNTTGDATISGTLTVGSCTGCGGITPAGDLSGNSSSQNVIGIQTHAIASPTTAGYVHWSGSVWEYANPPGASNYVPPPAIGVGPAYNFFDDFIVQNSQIWTTGNIGSPTAASWAVATSATDSGNHPGQTRGISGTGGAATGITLNGGAVANSNMVGLNAATTWQYQTNVIIGQLPGTVSASYQIGMVTVPATIPSTTGIGFYLSSANGVPNDWYCMYTTNLTDSTIALTTGSWHTLTIANDGVNVHWYVDGTERCGTGVAIASMPSAALVPTFAVVAGSGTSANLFYVDYVSFTKNVSR